MRLFFISLILLLIQLAIPAHSNSLALDFSKLNAVNPLEEEQKISRLIEEDPELKFLLPQKFYILDSKAERANVDDIIKKISLMILKTQMGSAICSAMIQGDSSRFEKYFGFSLLGLDPNEVALLCRNGSSLKRQTITSYRKNDSNDRAKKYHVFLLDSDLIQNSVQSWTGASNNTYIFLNKFDYNLESLTRILAHEIAISALSETRTPPEFGKDCERLALYEHPALQLAFRIYRAFQVENLILKELGFTPVGNFSECTRDLNSILPLALNYSPTLVSKLLVFTQKINHRCPDRLELSSLNLEVIAGLVQNNPPLCRFLSGLGTFGVPDSEFVRGPRPPINSGSGAKLGTPEGLADLATPAFKSGGNLQPNSSLNLKTPPPSAEPSFKRFEITPSDRQNQKAFNGKE